MPFIVRERANDAQSISILFSLFFPFNVAAQAEFRGKHQHWVIIILGFYLIQFLARSGFSEHLAIIIVVVSICWVNISSRTLLSALLLLSATTHMYVFKEQLHLAAISQWHLHFDATQTTFAPTMVRCDKICCRNIVFKHEIWISNNFDNCWSQPNARLAHNNIEPSKWRHMERMSTTSHKHTHKHSALSTHMLASVSLVMSFFVFIGTRCWSSSTYTHTETSRRYVLRCRSLRPIVWP